VSKSKITFACEQPTIARVFGSDYLFSLSSQPENEYYIDCGVQYQRYTLKECPAAKARLSNVLWQKSTL